MRTPVRRAAGINVPTRNVSEGFLSVPRLRFGLGLVDLFLPIALLSDSLCEKILTVNSFALDLLE